MESIKIIYRKKATNMVGISTKNRQHKTGIEKYMLWPVKIGIDICELSVAII